MFEFDPQQTAQDDLRSGRSPWHQADHLVARPELADSRHCDVLIVGAGITGSLAAQHFTRLGQSCCIIDREKPGLGSTAASTAMLQWEIDAPLSELTQSLGFERAANIYRRSFKAVSGLKQLVTSLGPNCALRERSSLYLTAGEIGARDLLEEHSLRERAGLPGFYLDYAALNGTFGFDHAAAILSPGSADADPLLLSQTLVADAVAHGAQIFDAEAISFDEVRGGVAVQMSNGQIIEARHVILATGYVLPDFVPKDHHRIASTWAIATRRQPGQLWRDGVLIWEASDAYSYARTTQDGRIIIGGEDDAHIVEPEAREKATPAKRDAIVAKLRALWPRADAAPEFVWSGAFGETGDGLPLIGAVPGRPRIFAAYGYGGNGITFSFLASRILASLVAGHHEAWHDEFAINRPVVDQSL